MNISFVSRYRSVSGTSCSQETKEKNSDSDIDENSPTKDGE